MPSHVVYVSRRDSFTQPLGAAFVVREIADDYVYVQFVIDKRRYYVKRWHVDFDPDGHLRGARGNKKRRSVMRTTSTKKKKQVLKKRRQDSVRTSAPSKMDSLASQHVVDCELKLSTWDRLVRFGSSCEDVGMFSENTVYLFGALVLPNTVMPWLKNQKKLTADMRRFARLWCSYCGAVAHCSFTKLDQKSKLLVVNVVCDDIMNGGRTGNVFVSLFFQLLVTSRHDQSVCSVVANVEKVGYAHRVDRAKPGVLVSSKALLRREAEYTAANRALVKFRKPLERVVWLIKGNENATTFLRNTRGRLHCFTDFSGNVSRLDPITNEIRYWSAENEKFMPRDEFFTTLDGVVLKKAAAIKAGDTLLLQIHAGEKERCKARKVFVDKRTNTVQLVVEADQCTKTIRKAKHDYVLMHVHNGVDNIFKLLEECPDVVNTLCMSVGHPSQYMAKRKFKIDKMDCETAKMNLTFEQYVIWRCAVALVVSSLKRRFRVRALKYEKLARMHLLTQLKV